jgi:quinol-cytochrome oxidoreductase complex cytochrome b subunit
VSLKLLTQEYVDEAERKDRRHRQEKETTPVEGFPFWPHETIRNIVIVCFFSSALLYLASLMPYFLEAPANPAGQPEIILPDWYLLWSYGFLKMGNDFQLLNGISGELGTPDHALWHFWDAQWWTPWSMGTHTGTVQLPIVGAFNAKMMGLIGLHTPILAFLFVLPFVDRGMAQRPQEQPLMASIGVFGLGILTTASIYSINNVLYNRWEILARTILRDQISPYVQFLQWDLLSWLSVLLPLLAAVGTYVGLRVWRERMMERGDRVFQLNRNYYRVR